MPRKIATRYRPSGRSARYQVTIFRGFKGKLLVLPFSQDLDADKIHVQAPTDVIFLGGGPISDLSDVVPLSLRDAFLKILENPALKGRDLIQAEEITPQISFFNKYENILDFETDLAQIVELIILFCESEGSLAELGAFAMINEIASRLFLVVREKHWNELSFIKLGPLRMIEKRYGRDSIFVVDDASVGMRGNSASDVSMEALKGLLVPPLTDRLARPREPTTFDARRSGHVIKLIVGLVQEYGALKADEILSLLKILNVCDVSQQDIYRYLLCAEAVGWLKEVSKGSSDYFVARATNIDAATIHVKVTAEERNKRRRRLLIREHWKVHDAQRFKAISEYFSQGAGL
ncbi:hypothetical protein FXV83_26405 [Bradyrhizobium hipponense]|uniref:Uncharacterized protein n=1 Tax=Bradyrhizobium hipponense TaxID=2605638 RepID=A0A5S4YJI0_9BRAD|nr:retron St85 family effector protein [Bradyrhizobium hipponense]TYO63637.1 hypothetical protein FXV83_26405 [Bradyrhizobium hipponense]